MFPISNQPVQPSQDVNITG